MTILSWVVMGWFLHHFILQPIACLLQLGQASETTLGIPINESGEDDLGRDELGRLTQLLTQMTGRLQDSISEAREQKIFFQALLNAIPDGIRVIDKNYVIVATNQAYHSQLGFPPTAISSSRAGMPCYASSHSRKHPCPPTLVTCPLHEINKTGQPLKTIMEHVRADGSKIQVEVCAAPLQIVTDGQTESFIVESVRDLTQAIQFSHEQKLASLGQLAAGVAHDIHNPLSSIRLALQSALRSLGSTVPNLNNIQHYLNIVDKQIDKCITVTRRLLKLSSSNSEHPQLICLKEIVTDTVSLLEYDANERSIDIQTQFGNVNYRVLAMESDMRMLVLNLLQNAFNAMPQGGHIHVQLRSRAGKIQLSIQDTGVGIPPHILNNIFEPFFSYRPNDKKGSGLGLAICKSIVERHQGRIEVSNTDQRGSQFVVTLPDAQTLSFSQPLAKAV
jgi:signal transduction histidine kinase